MPLRESSLRCPVDLRHFRWVRGGGWGELGHEIWNSGGVGGSGFYAEGQILLQFQGQDAQPWPMGRRNGLARGIYNRLAADNRPLSRAILNEVQFRVNQVAFGLSIGVWVRSGGFVHVAWRCP